jgi:hypothetical protein
LAKEMPSAHHLILAILVVFARAQMFDQPHAEFALIRLRNRRAAAP